MTLKQTHTVPVAAAKAGISHASDYRLKGDPTLPSQKKMPCGRHRPCLSGRHRDQDRNLVIKTVTPSPNAYSWYILNRG